MVSKIAEKEHVFQIVLYEKVIILICFSRNFWLTGEMQNFVQIVEQNEASTVIY